MAAVLACSSVLPRTTCIVPIVFSRLLFKSPPDLANQAVLKAVNKSPVPTKAAGNLGISTYI